MHYAGTSHVVRRTPGGRGPGWSARRAMVAAWTVSADDVDRWDREFAALGRAERQPRYFLCGFAAVGRRR